MVHKRIDIINCDNKFNLVVIKFVSSDNLFDDGVYNSYICYGNNSLYQLTVKLKHITTLDVLSSFNITEDNVIGVSLVEIMNGVKCEELDKLMSKSSSCTLKLDYYKKYNE